MPPVRSAGVLLHRTADDGTVEVLIGHMGGPFWARKDDAAWSVPKGEYEAGEEAFAVALRFARVKGYRPDKRPDEADTIETVRAIHERSAS